MPGPSSHDAQTAAKRQEWKPGEPTAKLLRESAATRGEDWSRLAAATAKLGVAWAEFKLSLDAYKRSAA